MGWRGWQFWPAADRLRLRRTMDALSAMLEEALAGHFDASHYDESRLSALEHQMARYLATSDLSNRNLRRARERVEQMVADIDLDLKVAVMGCVVNGPGEAKEADIGIAGGVGEGLIIKHGQIDRKVPENQLLSELRKELLNWNKE